MDTYSDLPKEFHTFVNTHMHQDPLMLRLKYHGDAQPWVLDAISHIECLKKCKGKFGELQPELMVSPLAVEQATSLNVALLHANIAKRLITEPHSVILDMTCGMGVDLHAMSVICGQKAIGIEIDPMLAKAGAYNFRKTTDIEIINGDSVEWLGKWEGERFDLIFIDPARRSSTGERVFNIRHCQPDVTKLLPLLAMKCRHAMVKLSPMLDVCQTVRDLPDMTELHIIDEGGECREMLAVLEFMSSHSATPIITIHSESSEMSFTLNEESASQKSYGDAVSGLLLFEPSPATMKAMPFGLLCSRYGLKKLHPNTHLFVNETPIDNLPGRWYDIAEITEFSSSIIRQLGKRISRADIATRNFPLKAEELQRRLKIKSGGDLRVVGTTVGNVANKGCHVLLVLKKMHKSNAAHQ